MAVYVSVFALILAYLGLVGAYLALRTLARVRRAAAAVTGDFVSSSEAQLARAGEQTHALTEQLTATRAELDTLRQELSAARTALDASASLSSSVRQSELAGLDTHLAGIAADSTRSLRNVALVRYDAFDDMAGRLSFSLALLDDGGDGVTLTAIAGRADTRVYAKGVADGHGEHELSPEELQAVRSALRPARRTPRRKAS